MTTLVDVQTVRNSPQACAALAYARQGWPVLPCLPRRKVPLTRDGFHSASADAETVIGWWRAEPAANVGVVPALTARADGATLLVLDCDGPAGLDAARALGVPIDTARVTTGRPDGGEHRYFSVPPGVRIGNRALAPGLDVRHAAGYVLVPPSVHPSGAVYRWQGAPAWAPGAVRPLPGVLLERLTATPRTAPPLPRPEQRGGALPSGMRGAPDAATCWRLARYVAKVPAGLPDGRKTTAFAFAAALLHDFALSRADAWVVLAGWNAENAPPLERARLETILDNAARYGGRRPPGRAP